jgi:hypothetical protein
VNRSTEGIGRGEKTVGMVRGADRIGGIAGLRGARLARKVALVPARSPEIPARAEAASVASILEIVGRRARAAAEIFAAARGARVVMPAADATARAATVAAVRRRSADRMKVLTTR